MEIRRRRMLLLQPPPTLAKEEVWLRKAYFNIVLNLIEIALTPSETFDPFATKFMGLESIDRNKHEYRAFMEVTSYFWASKGGRGALLEKVLAEAGGSNAANGMLLSQIPAWIAKAKNNQEIKVWKTTGSAPRLKFDLLNIIDDRLVFLEIKNRVDSGGTAAREEALAKKFLALSRIIQNGEKVYIGDNLEMDIAQCLLSLGIKHVEMHAGFLFGTDGKEASIESDRSKGFYAQSRKLLDDYYKAQNHRFSVKLTYDESSQRLSFQKDGLEVIVDLLYGSEVTRKYSFNQSDLATVLHKVFTRQWDDIWLSVSIAVSERRLLLEKGKNYMMRINQLLQSEADKPLIQSFRSFLADQDDIKSLSDCVSIIKNDESIRALGTSADAVPLDIHLADCLYVYAVAYPKYKKVKSK